MRTVAPLLVALALLTPACGGGQLDPVVERLSPRVFYGFAASVEGSALCLTEARDPDAERRCFEVTEQTRFSGQLAPNDLVKITYEHAEERFVATEIVRLEA